MYAGTEAAAAEMDTVELLVEGIESEGLLVVEAHHGPLLSNALQVCVFTSWGRLLASNAACTGFALVLASAPFRAGYAVLCPLLLLWSGSCHKGNTCA
jgi:hypothetical protein